MHFSVGMRRHYSFAVPQHLMASELLRQLSLAGTLMGNNPAAEFENDIRREQQMKIATKAKSRRVKFRRERELTSEKVLEIRTSESGKDCARVSCSRWRVRQVSTVRLEGDQTCPDCRSPLREINFYGRRLVGCIRCNLWGLVGSGRLFMELPAEDLEALSTRQAAAER